jgi:hypothetical protein
MPKIRLPFADIYYRKNDKEIKKTIKLAREGYLVNYKFYGKKIPKFRIRLVYSRKEFDRAWEGKTKPWQLSFADTERIVTFPSRLIKKYNKFSSKKITMKTVMIHEINHIFYAKVFKIKFARPLWIFEGLALNVHNFKLSKKEIKMIKEEDIVLPYATPRNPRNRDNLYFVSFLGVKYLLENYGKAKVFSFLRKFAKNQTKKNYKCIFEKVFKKSVNEIAKELKR